MGHLLSLSSLPWPTGLISDQLQYKESSGYQKSELAWGKLHLSHHRRSKNAVLIGTWGRQRFIGSPKPRSRMNLTCDRIQGSNNVIGTQFPPTLRFFLCVSHNLRSSKVAPLSSRCSLMLTRRRQYLQTLYLLSSNSSQERNTPVLQHS